MGTYTRQSGNRNMVEWVTGFNTIITNIIKAVMQLHQSEIFCLLAKTLQAPPVSRYYSYD